MNTASHIAATPYAGTAEIALLIEKMKSEIVQANSQIANSLRRDMKSITFESMNAQRPLLKKELSNLLNISLDSSFSQYLSLAVPKSFQIGSPMSRKLLGAKDLKLKTNFKAKIG